MVNRVSEDADIVADNGDQNTGERPLAVLGKPDGGEIMSVLTPSPVLEQINDGLGTLIGKLEYNEYRELAGLLMQLRVEEDADTHAERYRVIPSFVFDDSPRVQTRMQKLLDFVENSKSENIRNLKDLLQKRSKFGESDVMQQLILLTRLYYLKGVNMLNPEADPSKESSLKVRDDKDIVVKLGGKSETQVLHVGKLNGQITIFYVDENYLQTQLTLEPGKVYILGRGGYSFTVKNCAKNIDQVLGQDCVRLPGLLHRYLSRVGIAVECIGDEVFIYDRASKNHFAFSWERFSPEGKAMGGKVGISNYYSSPLSQEDGSVVLGDSESLSDAEGDK